MVEISNQHSTYVLYKHLNASKRRRWAKIQDPGGNSDQIEPHPGFQAPGDCREEDESGGDEGESEHSHEENPGEGDGEGRGQGGQDGPVHGLTQPKLSDYEAEDKYSATTMAEGL